jgi:hypothetical protein
MIPSPSSSVPLFHSLGGGTVEQMLKALAEKVLERKSVEQPYQDLFHHDLKVSSSVEQVMR